MISSDTNGPRKASSHLAGGYFEGYRKYFVRLSAVKVVLIEHLFFALAVFLI